MKHSARVLAQSIRTGRTQLNPRQQSITSIIAGDAQHNTLAQILSQLSSKSSRTPSAAGYTEIIRQAAIYSLRRNRADEPIAFGWEIAQAAISDAEKANLDLDISRPLFEVSGKHILLTSDCIIANIHSPFSSHFRAPFACNVPDSIAARHGLWLT
jgi:hypothetical protein